MSIPCSVNLELGLDMWRVIACSHWLSEVVVLALSGFLGRVLDNGQRLIRAFESEMLRIIVIPFTDIEIEGFWSVKYMPARRQPSTIV